MSEQTMRGRVVRMLMTRNAIAVENPALPGTPDVNYVEGWLELKQLQSWPVREDTNVTVEAFTPRQRVWHLRRRAAGGTSWVLLQCKREWLLLDGAVAAMHLDMVNKRDLIALAAAYTDQGMDEERLLGWISQPLSAFSFNDDVREKLRLLLRRDMALPLADT